MEYDSYEHGVPSWIEHPVLERADDDRHLRRDRLLGGSVMMAAADIEPGRFAVVADPTGAVFNVITMKR